MSVTRTMRAKDKTPKSSLAEVFWVFLRLGLSSFGGPVAHLAYFREECVRRRAWLSDEAYTEIVALCQFLPGPASSQVGIALGFHRGAYAGSLLAWLGFTLPSAIFMLMLAWILPRGEQLPQMFPVLHGLTLLAVAIVAQAVWDLGRKFCTRKISLGIMLTAAVCSGLWPVSGTQLLVLSLSGAVGALWLRSDHRTGADQKLESPSPKVGLGCLLIFSALLILLPLLRQAFSTSGFLLADIFYRTSALVFGGGHVVLPLLESQLRSVSGLEAPQFLAAYAAVQAMPGPLFSIAAYLGASLGGGEPHLWGGVIALLAIFTPAVLLVWGTLPFWQRVRVHSQAQAVMAGIHAGVVGLLLAAWYQFLWRESIQGAGDIVWVCLAGFALLSQRFAVWQLVLLTILVFALAGPGFHW